MTEKLLVSASELADLMAVKEALVFDCRFDLFHPARGRTSWLAAHIPGAVYAHLDDNLAGRITTQSGRHPLPLPRSFAAFLARSGWTPEKRVVAYDAHGGAFASRLWWLMKYFGLGNTSILDGGIGAWMSGSHSMESGEVKTRRQAPPELKPDPTLILNSQGVLNSLHENNIVLIDARAKQRFEGQTEPIDSVSGHIPGAVNHPMDLNNENGSFFRTPADLKSGFRSILKKSDPSQVVHMCGSGVTACQNLFAMELAGYKGSRLYPGSWSEWIRDPSRPILKGAA
jgi:thiosulfate/3-mercaptopyruvate sulfurtransferase